MSLPIINIIGCGRVGKTLARLLVDHKLARIQNIYNSSLSSSQTAVAFIGEGLATPDLETFAPADLYFFCTPDDLIEPTVDNLLQVHTPHQKSIFVHFSGSLSSLIFKNASELGYATASMHPIRSFADPAQSIKNFNGTLFAFEGDAHSYSLLYPLFSELGAEFFSVNKGKKALYHAASVFSSNYVVTLAHCAIDCYEKAGIPKDLAKKLSLNFMQNTITNLLSSSDIAAALTGPLERGDLNTIKKHIACLKDNSGYAALYSLLGENTLDLTKHTKTKKEQLLKALGEYNG